MRLLPLALGILVALLVWLLPWRAALGLEPFTIHMIRHMGLIAIVAPLLAAGLGAWASKIAPGVLAATVLEFLVVWGWHLPVAHEATAVHQPAFVAEQASFLVAGLLLWTSVLRAPNGLQAAGAMLVTSMHMTLLGALLILAPRPLYAAICFGANPISDQQLGGMLMLVIGTPVYTFAGLWALGRELERGSGAER